MPTHYFGGAPTAFQGGMEFADEQRRRYQRDNALAALIDQHGPQAGDPTAWGQVEGIQQRRDLHPYAVSGAERTDAAQQAMVDRHGVVAGDPTAHDMDDQLQQRAALNAAVFLQETKKRGGDLGAAFDRLQTILPSIGVPAEQLASWRQNVINDPDSVDELVAMLRGADPSAAAVRVVGNPIPIALPGGGHALLQNMSDGTSQILTDDEGNPYTPSNTLLSEGRLMQGYDRMQHQTGLRLLPSSTPMEQRWIDDATGRVYSDLVPGSEGEFQRQRAYAELSSAERQAIDVAVGLQEAARTVVMHGDRALGRIDRAWSTGDNTLSASARIAQSRIPGTSWYNIARDIQSVKDNIGINELLRIKRSGSGLGHVPQSQLETLQSVLGRMEVGRNIEDLQSDMENALRIFNDIVQRSEGEIEEIRSGSAQRRGQQGQRYGPVVAPPGTGGDFSNMSDAELMRVLGGQ